MTPPRRDAEPQWFKQRAVLTEDAVYLELGDAFGAEGALAWIALKGATKTQERLHRGHVDLSWRGLAAAAFTTPERAREVVTFLAELGAITLAREDRLTFACELPHWDGEQTSADARRKRDERARPSAPVHDRPTVSGTDPDPIEGEGDREAGETSSPATRASRRVDQDVLPDDFPAAHLGDRVEPVLGVLYSVHSLRGGPAPTTRGVGLALAAFPDRDHVAVARSYEHWATAGRGLRRTIRDHCSTYRSFLEREDPAPATAGRMVSPGQDAPNAKWWAGALEAEHAKAQS